MEDPRTSYVEAAFGDFQVILLTGCFFGWSILGSAAVMNILVDSLAVLFLVFLKSTHTRAFLFCTHWVNGTDQYTRSKTRNQVWLKESPSLNYCH